MLEEVGSGAVLDLLGRGRPWLGQEVDSLGSRMEILTSLPVPLSRAVWSFWWFVASSA